MALMISERERESSHSDKPQLYLCMVCDKRFMTKDCLKHHKVRHADEQLYSCAQCEKRFANEYSLRVHMNVHSSK